MVQPGYKHPMTAASTRPLMVRMLLREAAGQQYFTCLARLTRPSHLYISDDPLNIYKANDPPTARGVTFPKTCPRSDRRNPIRFCSSVT